jgi:predicted acetyltransferase
LAKVGDAIAGFALVGPADEPLGATGAHDVHEFFIMGRFRRGGFGQRMAAFPWNEYPGEDELAQASREYIEAEGVSAHGWTFVETVEERIVQASDTQGVCTGEKRLFGYRLLTPAAG